MESAETFSWRAQPAQQRFTIKIPRRTLASIQSMTAFAVIQWTEDELAINVLRNRAKWKLQARWGCSVTGSPHFVTKEGNSWLLEALNQSKLFQNEAVNVNIPVIFAKLIQTGPRSICSMLISSKTSCSYHALMIHRWIISVCGSPSALN